MTLAEFLLARIAEDESNDTTLIGVARKDWAARWAVECEAKRRMIESCGFVNELQDEYAVGLRDDVLRTLALPYADHPDYRQEWKP